VRPPNINAKYSYVVTRNEKGTWGYQVFQDSTLFIDQRTIPAIEGLVPFASKEDATAVAGLVVSKLRENSTDLPSISLNELDSLEITF